MLKHKAYEIDYNNSASNIARVERTNKVIKRIIPAYENNNYYSSSYFKSRPYQDALIQCDIRRVAEHADFNLWRRTCRMISGEVVLPNTPTVTGYASYNPCACPATTPAPTTAA